ncbi:ATP-grasp domain-containing protein [Chloroflexota bacterium]
MTNPVLILQTQSRGGLSCVRSLGEKGIPIVAADSDRLAVGFFSRYCSGRLMYPSPVVGEESFVATILSELGRRSYDMVVPMYDPTLLPLARHKAEVEKLTRFPFLDHESLMQGSDKARTVVIAERCGIRVPKTYVVHSEEDINAALEDLALPVVLRPREAQGSDGLRRITRRDEALNAWREVSSAFGPAVVQEYVPWGEFTYDVDVLMNRASEPRAVFVAKRVRTYPPLAGPTACGQGVEYPELADTAVRLLQEMGWYGPAEVEFRIDPRDGRSTLMEVNPRLWGSLYTATVSGIDFPYLLYRMAMDGDIEPVLDYRTDRRARYFFTLDMLCMATHPRKRTVAKEWLRDFVDPRTSMFLPSLKDPVPLLGKLLASIVYGARPSRLKRRLSGVREQRHIGS